MAKKRVYEIAKELGKENKEVLDGLEKIGITGKSHSSSLEDDEVDRLLKSFAPKKAPVKKTEEPSAEKKTAADAPAAKPATAEGGEVKKVLRRKPVPGKEGEVPKKKKKNIIQVFRPQNATSREAKNYSRMTGQGGSEERGRGGRPAAAPRRPERKPLVKVPRPQPVFRTPEPTPEERAAALEEATRRRQEAAAAKLAEEQAAQAAAEAAEAAKAAAEETPAVEQPAEAAPAAEERPAAQERPVRQERPARTDRPAQSGRGDRPVRSDRPAQGGRGDRPSQGARPDRAGQGGRGDRPSRPGAGPQNRGGRPGAPGRGPQSAPPQNAGAKKGGRDSRGKDKDKNKDALRENRFSDRRSGGKNQPSQLPKALQKTTHRPKEEKKEEVVREITLPEKLTIRELAEKMKMQPSVIVKKLFMEGMMVTVNQEIDFDKAQEIALDYDIIAEPEEKVDVIAELLAEEEDDESTLVTRPPVVCVMGHVDHGKTSLLDKIRDTHVTDREAGGITQHIGAYKVNIGGREITFLDTPGHEAFTAMRMRGANSTDIAVLVVAADDGVMPQTVEAINHAKAAGVEIIVAVNKIDRENASIDRVKQELTEYDLLAEDWGGSTVFAPVSAKTGEGIDNLLEMILLTADMLELKANPKRKARGLVLEAKLDKGKGPVANVLIQKGTLHVGDYIACGAASGRVRAMMDEQGRSLKKAGPSTPVEILGLNDVPGAGEVLVALDSDKEAKSFAATFISESRNKLLEETRSRMSLDDLFSQIQDGNLKELNLVVKADVQGSVEAVKQSLMKLSNEEVAVKVVHSGAGAINESDISLAAASNAIVIGFNVRPDATAKAIADQEKVDVRLYTVIYQAIEDVENAMKGMLEPVYEEKVIGHAEVRQLFKASGVGTIAGSYVQDGTIQRGCKVRISREGKQIFEGDLASLKRFKDDVKEVRAGYECGLVFDGFSDLQELDIVEAYIMVEVPRT